MTVIKHFAQAGYLSGEQLSVIRSSQESLQPDSLKSLLVQGTVPERVFASTMSSVHQIELLKREDFPNRIVEGTEDLSDFFLEHEVLPIKREANCMQLAMIDPSHAFVLQVLRAKLGVKITPIVAIRSELLSAVTKHYSPSDTAVNIPSIGEMDIPSDLDNESVLVRDLHRLIQRAVSMEASDIHFEPAQQSLRVRFRVSGMLQNIHTFDVQQASKVIARLKLMAKLDVTERRHVQNGRFKFPADGKVVDLRVSTLPLHDGESIVLRLLEFSLSQCSLVELGFSGDVADAIEQVISVQQGMILVTGPTGSGKSTTLYSLLNYLNKPELKLISIEDPVEINVPGINQIQIDEEHGITFSQALKSVLRQDPDVIMIGEIRDSETANLAAQAALTGHLVLSTLHTSSAVSAITRMQNLGLPNYMISATLKAVLAQRLVRRLCTQCTESKSAREYNSECNNCHGLGYDGRTIIAEFLPLSKLSSVSLESHNIEALLTNELLNGLSLYDDAKRVMSTGLVDDVEILRVLGLPVSAEQ